MTGITQEEGEKKIGSGKAASNFFLFILYSFSRHPERSEGSARYQPFAAQRQSLLTKSEKLSPKVTTFLYLCRLLCFFPSS